MIHILLAVAFMGFLPGHPDDGGTPTTVCPPTVPVPSPPKVTLPDCPEGQKCIAVGRFAGSVTPESVKPVVEAIALANKRRMSIILLEINSQGGSVAAGFELAKAIENSSAMVACVVDGQASSMAFYILQSCSVRMMTYRSTLMTHQVRMIGIEGNHETELLMMNQLGDLRATNRGACRAHLNGA